MERLFPLQPAQDSSEVSTSGASGSSKQQTGRGLSAEEKYQLVAQYDCGYSDEEEYPFIITSFTMERTLASFPRSTP